MSGKRKAWHSGTYHVAARACRLAAYADPSTRCRRCGLTYAEGVARWGAKRAAWQAGHVVDQQIGGPLAPEHATCNARAGNHAREPKPKGWG